jgi:[ribosomal protein S5]-alanine N-acetyltransferase
LLFGAAEGRGVLQTARMRLVPASLPLARAEIDDRAACARLLSAAVPDNWPPAALADALPRFLRQLEAAPDRVGWFGWYGVCRGPAPGSAELVASGGFTGPPRDGAAEVGYSVLPQHQGRGFATEMAGALAEWALSQAGVRRVVAETHPENVPSVRVLSKLGFSAVGAGREPGSIRFELPGRRDRA